MLRPGAHDHCFLMMAGVARGTQQAVFPVTNDDGALLGEVTLDEVRTALHEAVPLDLVVAADMMRPVSEPLVPGDDLHRASRLLARHGSEAVTVVRSLETREVLGLFGRRDLIVAYGSREEVQEEGTEPA